MIFSRDFKNMFNILPNWIVICQLAILSVSVNKVWSFLEVFKLIFSLESTVILSLNIYLIRIMIILLAILGLIFGELVEIQLLFAFSNCVKMMIASLIK